MLSKVSVFANVSPSSFRGHFTVNDVLKAVRSTKYKEVTDHLRSLTNAEIAKLYKAGQQDEQGRLVRPGHFYGVTWSGTFEGGKKASDLQTHSGLLCMDIDGLNAEQTVSLFEELRADEYTHVLFVSPSGNGLKWVVKIDIEQPDEHKAFFRQLSDYLHDIYRLTRKEDVPKGEKPQIDPSGCNVDRLCFLPYDPDAYHRPDSEIMPLSDEYQPTTEPEKTPVLPAIPPVASEDDTHRRLSDCITRLQQSGIDLTDTYEDWVKVGFAFASIGEEGRTYYHAVSQLYPRYNYQTTDAKFTELLRNRNGQVNIGSFFHLCEQATGEPLKAAHSYRNNQPPTDTPTAHLSPYEQEWPDPQPLETCLLPVLPMTADMIPEPLRPWLCDIAHRMKCPLDFVASAAMVMLSALIGTRLTIKPKTRDDWTVVPNLWGAIIGGPSAMKTPSISEVVKPLNRLTVAARAEYDDAVKQYERAVIEYEAQKKAYAKQEQDRHVASKRIENTVPYPEAPLKPKERRYMVNDTTVEKLADLLNENPTGLLQMRDELTGLLAAWDRAGHEQDRAFHLEAWNGNGSMTIDRIGRGTMHVNVICESLFGGIQPAKLLPYLRAATGYENDGFIQRLQVAVYPDPVPWEYGDEYPDKAARNRAFDIIQQLSQNDFKTIGYDADEYDRFPYTRFDADAQEIFKQWLIEWETGLLTNESGLLLEHFTKYRSLMPSLALIFHVVNCISDAKSTPPGPEKYFVSADAAQMAVRWCDYLASHARRIYGLLDTVSMEGAKTLLQRIKRGQITNGFKARDIARKGWSYLGTVHEVEAALSELMARHYVREVQPTTFGAGRPEAPAHQIHPNILSNA